MNKSLFLLIQVLFLSATFAQNQLDIKVFLEGPYLNNQMTPFINLLGYLPTDQPYGDAPFNYNGEESVAEIPSIEVVDWILFELRETDGDATTATVEKTFYRGVAFLMRDGSVKALDGVSLPQFSQVIHDNLYLAVFHRNHLSILSNYPLSKSGGVYTYDFTSNADQSYLGEVSVKMIGNGNYGMIAGNGLYDLEVENNDKNEVWLSQFELSGYYEADYNMNGQVDNDDRLTKWAFNAGRSSKVYLSELTEWECGSAFTDSRDGQVYTTVQIGQQCWMAENLNIGQRIDGIIE